MANEFTDILKGDKKKPVNEYAAVLLGSKTNTKTKQQSKKQYTPYSISATKPKSPLQRALDWGKKTAEGVADLGVGAVTFPTQALGAVAGKVSPKAKTALQVMQWETENNKTLQKHPTLQKYAKSVYTPVTEQGVKDSLYDIQYSMKNAPELIAQGEAGRVVNAYGSLLAPFLAVRRPIINSARPSVPGRSMLPGGARSAGVLQGLVEGATPELRAPAVPVGGKTVMPKKSVAVKPTPLTDKTRPRFEPVAPAKALPNNPPKALPSPKDPLVTDRSVVLADAPKIGERVGKGAVQPKVVETDAGEVKPGQKWMHPDYGTVLVRNIADGQIVIQAGKRKQVVPVDRWNGQRIDKNGNLIPPPKPPKPPTDITTLPIGKQIAIKEKRIAEIESAMDKGNLTDEQFGAFMTELLDTNTALEDLIQTAEADARTAELVKADKEAFQPLADYTIATPARGRGAYSIRSMVKIPGDGYKPRTVVTDAGYTDVSEVASQLGMTPEQFRQFANERLQGYEFEVIDKSGVTGVRKAGEITDRITSYELNLLKKIMGLKATPKAKAINQPDLTQPVATPNKVAPVAAESQAAAPVFGQSPKAIKEQKLATHERQNPILPGTEQEFSLVNPKPGAATEKPFVEPTMREKEAMGQQSLLGDESGKVNKKLLLYGAGALGFGLSASAAMKKWEGEEKDRGASDGKRIFEGGTLSDIGDALSLTNYAVASAAYELSRPGKQGIVEGFLNRRSFSDAGIVGLPADILTPEIPIGKIAKVANKIPFKEKISAVSSSILEAKAVRGMLDTLEYSLGATVRPETKAARETLEREIDRQIIEMGKWKEKVEPLARELRKNGQEFDRDVAKIVDAGWEAARKGDKEAASTAKQSAINSLRSEKGAKYTGSVVKMAKQVAELESDASNALVKAGMLDKEVAQAWKHYHLRRIYARFEDVDDYIKMLAKTDPAEAAKLRNELENIRGLLKAEGARIDPRSLLKRKDLSEELKALLQEIPEASTRLLSGQLQSAEIVTRANAYARLAEKVAIDEWREGYSKLPDAEMVLKNKAVSQKHFGELAGKYVPDAIYYDLMNSVPGARNKWLDMNATLVRWWKMGKVPTSIPATARNVMTNFLLADVLGKTSPFRVDRYYSALKSLITKDKYYDEARDAGTFLHDTWANIELAPQLADILADSAKDVYSKSERMKAAWHIVGSSASKLYGLTEEWFKMAVYINSRENGMPAEMAAEMADRALFNYRKVPRAVNAMRRQGVFPFITFSYKAIPAMAKEFWNSPTRLSRWTDALTKGPQAGVPDQTIADEREIIPEWARDGQVRMTDGKYLDASYLLPYQAAEQITDPTRRLLSTIAPLPTTAYEMAFNKKAFTGAPIVPEGATTGDAVKLYSQHAGQFALPAMTPGIGSAYTGMFGDTDKYTGTRRTPVDKALYTLGFKIRRFDLPKEKQKRLSALDRQYTKRIDYIWRKGGEVDSSSLSPKERAHAEKETARLYAELGRKVNAIVSAGNRLGIQ